jgi:UDP-3-O-[3-hydroxymyristoyl] glucosamine N-acyltransferase
MAMSFRIGDIAAALGAEAAGETGLVLTGAAEPSRATASDLAIALSPAYAAGLAQGQAQAALLWPGADWQGLGLRAAIFAPRGRLAMARLTALLDPGPAMGPGYHPTALIDPTARIGAAVRIGPFCVIGAGAVIGDGTRIGSHVSIAGGAVIGPQGLILDGVRIGRVRIGARVILQPNAVIGGDGFSFVTETASHVEIARATLGTGPAPQGQDPTWHRIHSLGGVVIWATTSRWAQTAPSTQAPSGPPKSARGPRSTTSCRSGTT